MKKGQFKWKIATLLIAIAFLVVILLFITDVRVALLQAANDIASRFAAP